MDIVLCRNCVRVNCPHRDKVRATYSCGEGEERVAKGEDWDWDSRILDG